MSKLELSGVSKTYGATVALRRGDLSVEAGEVHVLVGSNGSGKSTLCKIVAGSVKPDGGRVAIDGEPVAIGGPKASKAKGIGIFYQELSLAAHRTVEENICLADMPVTAGLFVDRKALSKRAEKYIALFETVSGDDFAAETVVGNLRADQRQLVEIMKTLATEAPILIFDEPTSALDRAQAERFFEILGDLKAEGRSIIFISHRMDEIFAVGDRVTVMRDGETVGTRILAETEPTAVIQLMVGSKDDLAEAAVNPPDAAERSGTPVLEVSGFSGPGFRDISFSVAAGEILGFGGLHGQGQSAVLRSLFGAEPYGGGRISLEGTPVHYSNPRDAILLGMAYVSGDRGRDGIVNGRPIFENVVPVHFLRNGLKIVQPKVLKKRVDPALDALRTKYASLWQAINSLSGGNQQKVVIARWLVDQPTVLLLDDPTKGVDLSAKSDLFALIRELAREGMGIVLYSSEDAELLNNADRILVFNQGRVTRELTGADRTRFNLYHAAYEAAS
ncbi:ribose transport system ATP-binding protein [Rhodobium orientis]|uniref:Sugar ABC transporter ATP-binding protein n=1 Tax=Rhodobium orientis TaxID=34017 RepID=A0A327JG11_9HYPH|nr:sugar ABC transporter ATP-binding protein [Rhodobium orientis]MBB4303859.1 ribose transport system ATP-binding protein [Rhodobium orientis]MBK5947976.1 sugar ABC transporter ATP-binding protein [Rhodobium orientis]RAI25337.1 sugar ABC transporter ATP-binding protein [Rhodobium orientis]